MKEKGGFYGENHLKALRTERNKLMKIDAILW
jgi:hypothetical protein